MASVLPLVFAAAGLLLAGCGMNGPEMAPGEPCLRCHSDVGGARALTLAGTVYERPDALVDLGTADVEVVVTDVTGQVLQLRSNRAGNFYTRRHVVFPITVALSSPGAAPVKMQHAVGNGECSSCHDLPPGDGALGRVYLSP